ncbi:peroxisome assembly protein (Peroxin-2), partial [Coemansia spiralis]
MSSDGHALPQSGELWEPAWAATQARIRARGGDDVVVPRNSRVSKLDAELLDDELVEMLREPVAGALALARPGLAERHRLEIDTAIKALLFWLSVGPAQRRATYGQGLQNLRYAGTGMLGLRLHLLGALTIGGGYAWARMVSAMSLRGWADAPSNSARARLWRLVQRAERFFRVAAVLNFVVFLATGQFRSVVERVLGLRLVHARPQLAHSVSFEFLNRQLVWHAFTEFVMFALPLVNPARARTWLVRRARRAVGLPAVAVDTALSALPEDVCAICFAAATEIDAESCTAVNPYAATPCGHQYCY